MSDPLEAISDLACIKEIIDGLTQDSKNELFKHFVTSLNNLANKVTNRPTTPVQTNSGPGFSVSKRPLNSPGSPIRSKNDGTAKVLFLDIISLLINE